MARPPLAWDDERESRDVEGDVSSEVDSVAEELELAMACACVYPVARPGGAGRGDVAAGEAEGPLVGVSGTSLERAPIRGLEPCSADSQRRGRRCETRPCGTVATDGEREGRGKGRGARYLKDCWLALAHSDSSVL